MFRDLPGGGGASALDNMLNTVEEGGEPAVFTSMGYIGDLETLANEVRRRGLRMASFPRGGLTILPAIPVTETELECVCEAYCRADTIAARAAIRQGLYLRDYPLANAGGHGARALYHPADVVIKLAELCARVVGASPAALERMIERTPYLHMTQIRSLCERIQASAGRGAAPGTGGNAATEYLQEQVDAFREQVGSALDDNQYVTLPVVHTNASVPEIGVEPGKIFHADALEEAGGDSHVLEDLTGLETVDHVRDTTTAEYLSADVYPLVTSSAIFYDGDGDGKRLAAVYIANALSPARCKAAALALEPAATHRNLRATTNGGVPPDTGIVGYYDYLNNPTQHKCRETNYMRGHFGEVMEGAAPLLRDIDDVYRKCAPVHHNLQRIAIPSQFQLFDTVFSTITVNRNFRTAVHTDSGDFRSGLGVLCVIDGEFEGCHLAVKKLKRAFRLKVGDVLLFDTSLEHGNTEVLGSTGDWKRVSLVCYLRNGLMSAVCELERRKHLNRLIVDSLDAAVGYDSSININSVDPTLPPLFVPVRLASKLATAQLSALTFVAERARKNSGCVLAMTMGLGKTLIALTLCHSFLHQNRQQDILVLVPKPIIRHWVSEYDKWSALGLHLNYLVASDELNSRKFEDDLLRYEQQVKGLCARVGHVFLLNPEYVGNFVRRFSNFAPGLIIADEGHRVAVKGSKLTAVLSRLTCPLRVVLSGTPLQNNADELYRIVGWVNSGVHTVVPPRVFAEFAADIDRYVKGDDGAFHNAVVAQRYIQDWMKGFVFREMETDLPPLYDYLLVCGSSATQRRIEAALDLPCNAEGHSVVAANEHRVYHLSTHPLCYWAFVTGGYQSIIKGGSGDAAADAAERLQLSEADLLKVERYYALVQNGDLDRFIALSGKLAVLVHIVRAVKARGEKVIIFSQYIGTQDIIHRTLTACALTAFTVRGRDSLDRRKNAMGEFDTDSSLVALILSTRIAAYGLDFTAANHVVLFDSWWNPQVDAQAVARAYRRNQTKPVTVYRLASQEEDRSVLRVQTRKMALFNCIMHERPSRAARPGELEDCADTEDDAVRGEMWRHLKALPLEGDFPALTNIYRYQDGVKETEPAEAAALPTTAADAKPDAANENEEGNNN